MPVQIRNDEMVALLAADLQRRYEPNFAWKSAVSQYLALPGLRAFWPMSAVDYSAANRALDVAGGGYHLTANNAPTFGHENLIPYVEFDSASSQYLSRADGGAGNWADITGGETYIESGKRGVTLGGWFKLGDLTSGSGLMSKWDGTTAGSSYLLFFRGDLANDPMYMYGSDGAISDSVGMYFSATAINWWFIAGRYERSSQKLAIFVNDDSVSKATSLGNLNDSTIDFRIGSMGSWFFKGKASMCFLCAASLSDTQIWSLFQQSRAMFNV